MIMAPSPLLLLLLLLLSIHGHTHTAASPSSPPAPVHHRSSSLSLLQSTCNSTTYYDLCVASLAADPSSSTADVRGLGAIAVSAAAANASATASALLANATAMAEQQQSGRRRLLISCAAKYADSREALQAARESIVSIGDGQEEAYDYALLHVGAAAEYPAVCRALFRRQRMAYPVELARRQEGLEHLCTIALDIISLLLP